MKNIKNTWQLNSLVTAAAMAVCCSASANTVTMDLGTVTAGGFPTGSGATSPYLVAVFQDVAGGVQLTLTAPGLGFSGSGNFQHVLNGWEFNADSTYANTLSFSVQSQVGTFTDPTISQSAYGTQASGGATPPAGAQNKFDVSMKFAESDATPPTSEFGNGDQLVLFISSSVTGLSASDFNITDPSSFTYYSEAAIDDANAGTWVGALGSTVTTQGVPDSGSSVTLLGMALAGLAGLSRKFSRV